MKTLCVAALVVVLAYLADPGHAQPEGAPPPGHQHGGPHGDDDHHGGGHGHGQGGDHGHGHGHGDGHGKGPGKGHGKGPKMDYGKCLDRTKFNDFAATAEGCDFLKAEQTTTAPVERQESNGSPESPESPESPDSKEPKGPKKHHKHHGHHGHHGRRGFGPREMGCFFRAANIYNRETNETNIDAFKSAVDQVTTDAEKQHVSDAVDGCNTSKATTLKSKDESMTYFKCIDDKLSEICGRDRRPTTTPASV